LGDGRQIVEASCDISGRCAVAVESAFVTHCSHCLASGVCTKARPCAKNWGPLFFLVKLEMYQEEHLAEMFLHLSHRPLGHGETSSSASMKNLMLN